jgi:ATP-binding cassette, subfamily A (ABC1), member 3
MVTDGPASDLQLTQDQKINLPLYLRTLYYGMIGANTLVETAILQLESGNSGAYFENRVSPEYQEYFVLDAIYSKLKDVIGMLVILPLLIIYLRQTSAMLSEKESKVKESMYIIGMTGFSYYFTWFVRVFIVYEVVFILSALILSQLIPYFTFYIPFLVFTIFGIVLILQSFFVQVFLTRAKIGLIFAFFFFIFQYVLSFIVINSDNPSLAINLGISFVPHVAIILTFKTLIYAQSYEVPVNFTEPINSYIIGYALLGCAVNIVFYLIATWYLDQVVPNEWGAKRHPLFCLVEEEKTASLTEEEKNTRKQAIRTKSGYQNGFEDIEEQYLEDE